MPDPLEKFIQNNRDKFDQSNPGSDLWNNIQNGLAQNAAGAGSGTATGAATKTGLAAKLGKLSLGWKLAAGLIATLAITASIYLAVNSGSNQEGEIAGSDSIENVTDNPGGDNLVTTVADETPLVNPPVPGVDIPFETFTVSARKGGEWTSPKGTLIEIPKGIFVDANGNKVKGDVDIHFREFHDAADVILSGITMKYDDGTGEYDFQTAGMMEIQGSQEGEPVFIREGETIQIKIASLVEEANSDEARGEYDDYGLYFLDPEEGWQDIGKAKIEDNKDKRRKLQQIENLPPEPNKPQLITDADGGFGFDVDYSEFPELKPFKNLKWKALNEGTNEKDQWATTKTWSSIELEAVDPENMVYRIVLGHRKGSHSMEVTPMFSKEDYDKEMVKFNKKLERHKKIKEDRKQRMAVLNGQADIRRSFDIAGFGTYNCDRYFRNPYSWTLNVDLILPDDFQGVKASELDVYHITRDNRMAIPYKLSDMKVFRYFPEEENYLVSLLPDKTIGVVKPKDFEKVSGVGERTEAHDQTFNMQQVQMKIHNAADLRMALGI